MGHDSPFAGMGIYNGLYASPHVYAAHVIITVKHKCSDTCTHVLICKRPSCDTTAHKTHVQNMHKKNLKDAPFRYTQNYKHIWKYIHNVLGLKRTQANICSILIRMQTKQKQHTNDRRTRMTTASTQSIKAHHCHLRPNNTQQVIRSASR